MSDPLMSALSPLDEADFQNWYRGAIRGTPINPNPDDPRHFYDYRSAYLSGVNGPNQTGHWPSTFKLEGHPRMVLDGMNTKTGKQYSPSLVDALLNQ